MKTRLRLGAILHFIIAIGHIACLFFLEEAFKAYDILDVMTNMCFGQTWLLYVLTIALALAFAVAGLYALSAAGDIKRLPLLRLVRNPDNHRSYYLHIHNLYNLFPALSNT